MDFEQPRDIELWLLEDLDLSDVDVVHRVDLLANVLDFLGNRVRDELLDELLEVAAGCFSLKDVDHLGSDNLLLCRLCVRSLSDLEFGLLGEANDEDSDDVAVRSLDVAEALNKRLPLLDERLQLVGGEIHAVEVGEEASALDVFNLQDDLLVERLVVLEVVEADFVDPAHEAVLGELHTLGSGDNGMANVSLCEVGRGLDIIPFLFLEDVSLLVALTLVFVQLLLEGATKEKKEKKKKKKEKQFVICMRALDVGGRKERTVSDCQMQACCEKWYAAAVLLRCAHHLSVRAERSKTMQHAADARTASFRASTIIYRCCTRHNHAQAAVVLQARRKSWAQCAARRTGLLHGSPHSLSEDARMKGHP